MGELASVGSSTVWEGLVLIHCLELRLLELSFYPWADRLWLNLLSFGEFLEHMLKTNLEPRSVFKAGAALEPFLERKLLLCLVLQLNWC